MRILYKLYNIWKNKISKYYTQQVYFKKIDWIYDLVKVNLESTWEMKEEIQNVMWQNV